VIPSLPASFFIATPTINVLATPTGTISAQLATQIALTPLPVPTVGNTSGCVANKLMITSPKPGSEISGSVDLTGTVDIPDFAFYKYEVALINTDIWTTIAASRKPVDNGPLDRENGIPPTWLPVIINYAWWSSIRRDSPCRLVSFRCGSRRHNGLAVIIGKLYTCLRMSF